jgi:hypothetical protein
VTEPETNVMSTSSPPETIPEPVAAVLDPRRVPCVGDAVFFRCYDPLASANSPLLAVSGTITAVCKEGDPDSAVDLEVADEQIDVFLPIHYQENMTRINKWVHIATDEGGFERPIRHDPTKMELPPVDALVGLLRPAGGRLELVKVRVVAHVEKSNIKLVLAGRAAGDSCL